MSNFPDPDESLSEYLRKRRESGRRRLWTTGAVSVLLVAFVVILAVPTSRYFVLGMVRGEHFFEGRPTGYWEHALSASGQDRNVAVERLTAGGAAAVPVLVQIVERKSSARSGAIQGLEGIAPLGREAIPALIVELRADERDQAGYILSDSGGAASVLAKFGPEAKAAVPHLLARLQDGQQADAVYHDALLAIEPARCDGLLLRRSSGGGSQWLTPVWVSNDGKSLVGLSDHGELVRWSVGQWHALAELQLGMRRAIVCTPDGTKCAFFDDKSEEISTLDLATLERNPLRKVPHLLSIAISHEGRFVGYVDFDGNFEPHALDARSGEELPRDPAKWPSRARTAYCAFSPVDNTLAVAGQFESFLWEVVSGDVRSLDMESGFVFYSDDGSKLGTSTPESIWVFDIAANHRRDIETGPRAYLESNTVFCLGGKAVAAITGEHADVVTLWSTNDGRKMIDFKWHEESRGFAGRKIRALAVSPDGMRLVSCDEDGWIKYWNLPQALAADAPAGSR